MRTPFCAPATGAHIGLRTQRKNTLACVAWAWSDLALPAAEAVTALDRDLALRPPQLIKGMKRPLAAVSQSLAKTEKVVQVRRNAKQRERKRAQVCAAPGSLTRQAPRCCATAPNRAAYLQDVSYQFKLFNDDLRELDEALARLSFDILPQYTSRAASLVASPQRS